MLRRVSIFSLCVTLSGCVYDAVECLRTSHVKPGEVVAVKGMAGVFLLLSVSVYPDGEATCKAVIQNEYGQHDVPLAFVSKPERK